MNLDDVILQMIRQPLVKLLHPVLDGVHRTQDQDLVDLETRKVFFTTFLNCTFKSECG